METKTESKTIREWLNDLPEDIRERAVRNYDHGFGEGSLRQCVRDAVAAAFSWPKSPEGTGYWANVYADDYGAARAFLKRKEISEWYADNDDSGRQSPPSPDLREQLDEALEDIKRLRGELAGQVMAYDSDTELDEAVGLLKRVENNKNRLPETLADDLTEFLSKHK